jgi:hypothetical protein
MIRRIAICIFGASIWLNGICQFDGSFGDGAIDAILGPVRLDGIHLNIPFQGGSGDGETHQSLHGQLNEPNLFAIYAGGMGDGFDAKSQIAFLNFQGSAGVFGGGAGDGHTVEQKQSFLNFRAYRGLFGGGPGDGFTEFQLQSWFNQSSIGLYTGGVGDGVDDAGLQQFLGTAMPNMYGGGSGDGHDVFQKQVGFPAIICGPGDRIYVNIIATGTKSGYSWQNAFSSLPLALVNAEVCPADSLWIARGIYMPTNSTDRSLAFHPTSNTHMIGGFKGTESLFAQRDWIQNQTILSGNIGHEDKMEDNSFHVVDLSEAKKNMSMDGLIIEDGNADQSGNNDDQGAGIINQPSLSKQKVDLKNMTIRNCHSLDQGAALFSSGDLAKLRLSNVIFRTNSALNGVHVWNQDNSILDLFGPVDILK